MKLDEQKIRELVTSPCTVEVYDQVGSTNDMAKERTLSHKPLVLIANQQTGGRGRMDRTFLSPAGTGLYMSIALKPSFALSETTFVTMAAAVALCRAIKRVCGIDAQIKWVNDTFYKDRKVSGILTEATVNPRTGTAEGLIIGTGINCFPGSFPEEISHIAGPLATTPEAFDRNVLAAALIDETWALISQIQDRRFLDEYRQHCLVIGRQVKIHPQYDGPGILAEALDIADDGGLIVRYLEGPNIGVEKTLYTGEISISL